MQACNIKNEERAPGQFLTRFQAARGEKKAEEEIKYLKEKDKQITCNFNI